MSKKKMGDLQLTVNRILKAKTPVDGEKILKKYVKQLVKEAVGEQIPNLGGAAVTSCKVYSARGKIDQHRASGVQGCWLLIRYSVNTVQYEIIAGLPCARNIGIRRGNAIGESINHTINSC